MRNKEKQENARVPGQWQGASSASGATVGSLRRDVLNLLGSYDVITSNVVTCVNDVITPL